MRASLTGLPRPHSTPRELRLDFVDGMRALLALALLVQAGFHMNGLGLDAVGVGSGLPPFGGALGRAVYLLYEGVIELFRYAVPVFVVLSGFSLMLPIVRRDEEVLPDGLLRFYLQRARRILPPYYAALALTLLMIVLVPGLNAKAGVYWDIALPAIQRRPIVAHLLLIHNRFGDPLAINPPLWTMAVWVQLVALFPLLALLWRPLGTMWMVTVAVAYGFFMTPVRFDTGLSFPFSSWWFVGLLALGMAAASLSYSRTTGERALRDGVPWLWWSAACMALFFGLKLLGLGADSRSVRYTYELSVVETVLGAAVMCLLVELSRARPAGRLSLAGLLSRPLLVTIGHFSYSLYLLHVPVLAAVAYACRVLSLPPVLSFVVIVVFGSLLAVGLAYLFHLAFERPFLSSRAKRAVQPLPPPAPPPTTVAVN